VPRRYGFVFEWDPAKAETNLRKHGVSFTEAASVFGDPDALNLVDRLHPDREVLIGHSERARVLFVVYLERRDDPRRREIALRLISARRATPKEQRDYARARQKS
jgi:uncharacterized DUF497 family protein